MDSDSGRGAGPARKGIIEETGGMILESLDWLSVRESRRVSRIHLEDLIISNKKDKNVIKSDHPIHNP